ncbi:MAG: class I SAM-dependent methyltransferase [Ardenticatenales bacterium]
MPEDHFSRQPDRYAQARPRYPAALFAFLADLAPATGAAWDCATGSGQAAIGLAERFDVVYATDLSAAQIAQAAPHPRIRYAVAPAEACGLPDASVDAVTVATAAHWLDLDRFYVEVRRVVRPGGVVALWSYYGNTIEPALESSAPQRLHREILGSYWAPGNALAGVGYDPLPFPFDEVAWPGFEATTEWTVDDFLDYLRSWSAAQTYTAVHGSDPVDLVADEIRAAWGDVRTRRARWDLFGRVGRVGGVGRADTAAVADVADLVAVAAVAEAADPTEPADRDA